MLMGYPEGSTSGHAATQIDQGWSLGDSWDVCTMSSLMLHCFSKYSTIHVDGPLCVCLQSSGRSAKQVLLATRAEGEPDAIVQLLATLTMGEHAQLHLLQLIKPPTSPALYAGSVLDSGTGSSKHLHSKVQVTHSDDLPLSLASTLMHSQHGHYMTTGQRLPSTHRAWYCHWTA